MAVRVGITSGLRGYFAVLYDDRDGDPIQSGIGSYRTKKEAVPEARDWAESEGIPFDDDDDGGTIDKPTDYSQF